MKDFKLEYIKANGIYYRPQKAGVQNPEMIKGVCYPVCVIKKLLFGRWQVDYFSSNPYSYKNAYDNQKPVNRLILYPNGIEEIRFTND